MTHNDIELIFKKQQDFFFSGKTKSIEFRKHQLIKLREAVVKNENKILSALKSDLSKPSFEALVGEIDFIIMDIDHSLKNINKWAKPTTVKTPIMQKPGKSYIQAEPYGVALVISPWNYPFQLAISPLIGAIAAGNCAIIKVSELSPATSQIIEDIITECFPPEYVITINKGIPETKALLSLPFDYIFYTGSTSIGKIIMEAAAKNLTPVTLELGGKSPCIVDKNIDIKVAARRIAWGKFFNAGQTCVAPDYIYLHKKVADEFLNALTETIKEFYSNTPNESQDYGRIINKRHFERLIKLIDSEKVFFGGKHNIDDHYIEPTILTNITWNDKVMQEEIFGPILPVIIYDDIERVVFEINKNPKPLSLYIFSKDKSIQDKIIQETSSGSICINDTIMQISNMSLPFGGVGQSGMGAYHGKNSFDTFSHKKSILKRAFIADFKMRYPPYINHSNSIRSLMRWIAK